MASAQRTIEINATPLQCYKVITDFVNYPKFVSGSKAVKILEKKGDVWKIEQTVSMIKEISFTLEMTGVPGKSLTWKLIKGYMKKNDGSWLLEAVGKGKTRATYTLDLDLGAFVPKAIINKLAETSFPKMLQEFKDRIEAAK